MKIKNPLRQEPRKYLKEELRLKILSAEFVLIQLTICYILGQVRFVTLVKPFLDAVSPIRRPDATKMEIVL